MKKLSILFSIILYFPLLTSAQTLIGSWNFNGNANDGSGNGLNGTVYNATLTAGQAGIPNTAYKFNGSSAHIDVPYNSLLDLTTWTIQVILRVDGFNSSTCQAENILTRGTQYTNDIYEIEFNDNAHDNSCAIYSPSNTEFTPAAAGSPTTNWHDANYIQLNTWYCHTVTYDGIYLKTFINGTLVDSAAWSNQYSYGSTQPVLTIGYYPLGGANYPYWFNGAIDNLTIWSGAFSNAAVAASCNSNTFAIVQPFTDTLKCAGGTLSVPYTESGSYSSTNTFTLQLSNSSGSFSSPANIGSVTSTSAGTITGTIPSTTVAGTGYRVRIVSSSPSDTSADDGVNIHISTLAPSTFTNNLPVCVGDTIKLTASNTGAVSYQWTDPNNTVTTSQNRIIPNATSANAGNYAVSITNGGCVQHDTLTAVVYARPNPLTTSSNSPVCSGTYIGLSTATTTTGVTYSWSGPNGFSSTLPTPVINNVPLSDSGRYYVSVTANGCSTHDSTYVVITPSPTVTTSYRNPVCVGDSINIYTTVSAGSTLSWSGTAGYSGSSPNVQLAHATAANSGSYILSASRNGCFTRDTINLSVNPIPAKPTAGSNSPVCAGANLSLTALNITGATYIWTGPTGYGATTRTASRTVAYADSGSYIVGATVNGCTSYDTTHVLTLQAPTGVTYGSNGPICVGDTLKVTANNQTSGVSYSWAGPGSYSSSQQNFNILHSTTANGGNYYLTTTYGSCVVHDTLAVTVNPLPNKPTISSNSPVCTFSTLTLNAVGTPGATYSWTGPYFGSNLQNPILPGVQAPNAGRFIVTATLNGCKAADTTNVSVLAAPLGVGYGSNGPICAGDTLRVTSANMTGGSTYSWIGPGFSSSQQNFTITHTTTANSGNYYLTVSVGSCSVHDTLAVTVNPLPNKPTISSNNPVCSGNTLSFTAVATAGAIYSWSGPTGFSILTRNPTRSNIALADSGYYTVTAILNGCLASDTTHVTVNPSPVGIVYSSNSPICAGDPLNVTSSSQTPGVTYSWSGPGNYTSTTASFSITNTTTTNSGNYNLAVTYNSCTVYDTLAVVVKPLPTIPTAGSNSPVCTGSPLNLTSFSGAGVSYSWSGPGSYTAITQNPTISSVTAANAGTYTVTAKLNGCTATNTTGVTVNPIPTGTASSNSPVCAGNNLLFSSSVSPAAATYGWSGPGGFISSLPNPSITNATPAADGIYALTVALGNCTTVLHVPVTITPLAGPPIVTIGTPFDTVCGGDVATFTASSSNAGSSPTYAWKINGAATGATGSSYSTTTLHNGDLVTCDVTSNGICQPVLTSSSNAVWMHVKVSQVPKVSIELSPSVYNPGGKVKLTAIVQGSSDCLTYQWRVNGVNLGGVTGSSFETYTLKPGDKVSLYVHSSCSCTNPDTVVVSADALDIKGITNAGNYKVYPNPAQDEVTIEGEGSSAQLEVYDMSGRQIWTKAVKFSGGSTHVHLSLPSGVYSLRLADDEGNNFTDRLVIIK